MISSLHNYRQMGGGGQNGYNMVGKGILSSMKILRCT